MYGRSIFDVFNTSEQEAIFTVHFVCVLEACVHVFLPDCLKTHGSRISR